MAEMPAHTVTEAEINFDDYFPDLIVEQPTEQDPDNDADIEDAGHYENLSDLEPCEEMAEEFRQERGGAHEDDDLDEYEWEISDIEASDASNDSEAPSDWYEDVEGSSEDEIFEGKDWSKDDRRMRLSEMRRRRVAHRRQAADEEIMANFPELPEAGQWYSDADGDENFDEPPESDHEGPKFAIFKDGDSIENLKFHVGLRFGSVEKYKEVLTDWSIRKGFGLDFKKCESKRVTAVCAAKGCQWRIHASVKQGEDLFQVKTLKGRHTCARKGTNKRAKSRYIAKRMEQTIKDFPDVRIERLISIVRRVIRVEISYWVGLRAKKYAVQKIRGEDEKEFAILWDYCETVRQTNPGSTVILEQVPNSSPPKFDRMYYSLAAQKQGFLAGCRPLIGLDGCFIKTVHGGQLLAAVSKDGNDNLWPIAIAYVKSENSETWKWFLRILVDDIGGEQGGKWTFLSDRQKGLLDALNEVVPECEHRYCLRHLYQNFQKTWKSQEMKHLFWRAASAGNRAKWRKEMNKIRDADPRLEQGQLTAHDWLMRVHPESWARSFFRTSCKSDVLVNNICESFNNMILPARDLPVIGMFEWYRNRIMTRIQTKRTGMTDYDGVVCPNVLRKLNRNLEIGADCTLLWAGRLEFQVTHGENTYIVKLDEKICSCGMFQLNAYPCPHAAICINDRRFNDKNMQLWDYFDDCYKKPAYLAAYEYMIHGVPDKNQFIRTAHEPLLAPDYKIKRGRPAKKRRKAANEEGATSTRKGLTHTCCRCYVLGHNVKSCTNPPHPNSRFYTVGLNATNNGPRRPSVRGRGRGRGRGRIFNPTRARAEVEARVRSGSTSASGRRGAQTASRSPQSAATPQTPTERTQPAATLGQAATKSAQRPPSSQMPPFAQRPSYAQTRPPSSPFIPLGSVPTTFAPGTSSSRNDANSGKKQRQKRTTESQAFENVRERARERRNQPPWKL